MVLGGGHAPPEAPGGRQQGSGAFPDTPPSGVRRQKQGTGRTVDEPDVRLLGPADQPGQAEQGPAAGLRCHHGCGGGGLGRRPRASEPFLPGRRGGLWKDVSVQVLAGGGEGKGRDRAGHGIQRPSCAAAPQRHHGTQEVRPARHRDGDAGRVVRHRQAQRQSRDPATGQGHRVGRGSCHAPVHVRGGGPLPAGHLRPAGQAHGRQGGGAWGRLQAVPAGGKARLPARLRRGVAVQSALLAASTDPEAAREHEGGELQAGGRRGARPGAGGVEHSAERHW